jgi:hypothetical protein
MINIVGHSVRVADPSGKNRGILFPVALVAAGFTSAEPTVQADAGNQDEVRMRAASWVGCRSPRRPRSPPCRSNRFAVTRTERHRRCPMSHHQELTPGWPRPHTQPKDCPGSGTDAPKNRSHMIGHFSTQTNWYPTPRTVLRNLGDDESSPIFWRMRETYTSILRSYPL